MTAQQESPLQRLRSYDMTTGSLLAMKKDLEDTASHLEHLSHFLRGQAVFLESRRAGDFDEDLLHIQNRLGGLAITVHHLRGAAKKIADAA